MLEFKDDLALERLTILRSNLVVEYFAPKASYPAMPPNFKGLGTLSRRNKIEPFPPSARLLRAATISA